MYGLAAAAEGLVQLEALAALVVRLRRLQAGDDGGIRQRVRLRTDPFAEPQPMAAHRLPDGVGTGAGNLPDVRCAEIVLDQDAADIGPPRPDQQVDAVRRGGDCEARCRGRHAGPPHDVACGCASDVVADVDELVPVRVHVDAPLLLAHAAEMPIESERLARVIRRHRATPYVTNVTPAVSPKGRYSSSASRRLARRSGLASAFIAPISRPPSPPSAISPGHRRASCAKTA